MSHIAPTLELPSYVICRNKRIVFCNMLSLTMGVKTASSMAIEGSSLSMGRICTKSGSFATENSFSMSPRLIGKRHSGQEEATNETCLDIIVPRHLEHIHECPHPNRTVAGSQSQVIHKRIGFGFINIVPVLSVAENELDLYCLSDVNHNMIRNLIIN